MTHILSRNIALHSCGKDQGENGHQLRGKTRSRRLVMGIFWIFNRKKHGLGGYHATVSAIFRGDVYGRNSEKSGVPVL